VEKVDLKIAYLLMVHKNPEQFNKFLRQLLCDNQAEIYVHIDKKSVGSIADKIIDHARIIKTSESVEVTWGDISQVDAMLILLKEAVKSGRKYDFVIYKSGEDMMVRNGYKEYLADNLGKSYFEYEELDLESEKGALFKVRYPKTTRKLYDTMHPYRIFRVLLRKLYGKGINLFPNKAEFSNDIKMVTGSTGYCVTMELAGYMVRFLEDNPWFYRAYVDSLAPDRMFFNTLAVNSPFRDRVVNKTHTFEYWGETYKNNNHPVIFTKDNIDEIENSDCFFARKFDSRVDREVIEYFLNKIIKSEIEQRTVR
jgi:hypothetical protein